MARWSTRIAYPVVSLAGFVFFLLEITAGRLLAPAIGFSLEGNSDGQEQAVASAAPLPTTLAHVAVVANDTADSLVLYVNGKRAESATWTGKLSAINDVNCWLGRSQYDGDPELDGVIHEFRIYGSALVDSEVATSFIAGADPAFLSD